MKIVKKVTYSAQKEKWSIFPTLVTDQQCRGCEEERPAKRAVAHELVDDKANAVLLNAYKKSSAWVGQALPLTAREGEEGPGFSALAEFYQAIRLPRHILIHHVAPITENINRIIGAELEINDGFNSKKLLRWGAQ